MAPQTEPGDFTAVNGTLSFAPGQTTRTITVPVNGDTSSESNETFFVNLANSTNADIADGQGLGTITDDDAAVTPSLSINDVAVTEGNSGSTNASFTVTLSSASSSTVTVDFFTSNGSSAEPGDYTAGNGTVTFAPWPDHSTINVAVNGDTLAEANETFFVNLSNPPTPTSRTDREPERLMMTIQSTCSNSAVPLRVLRRAPTAPRLPSPGPATLRCRQRQIRNDRWHCETENGLRVWLRHDSVRAGRNVEGRQDSDQ
jgi:hypothetical protein